LVSGWGGGSSPADRNRPHAIPICELTECAAEATGEVFKNTDLAFDFDFGKKTFCDPPHVNGPAKSARASPSIARTATVASPEAKRHFDSNRQ
jgi:hypothetical protein